MELNKILIILFYFIKLILSSREWDHNVWLDPYNKYNLKWKSDDESEIITFEAIVETKGWIGFGLSPNGGMKGSDVVIGWVNDEGKSYFQDRYAIDEALPQIDKSQDWQLIEGSENSTHTIIKFSRPYVTCDKENDRPVTMDSIKVIYAYGNNDPLSINTIIIHNYHERGSKTLQLINTEMKLVPQENDLTIMDFKVNNITIPNRRTTYWCKIFKVKNVKRHVVMYGPYKTSGNEQFLHRMSIYSCNHPDVNKLEPYLNGDGIDCTDSATIPKDIKHCFTPYFIWASGADDFILPPETGFPIGGDSETLYLSLQIQYYNPNLISGLIDSSGIRTYVTKKLRKYDAFTLTFGDSPDFHKVIPPRQENFRSIGFCDPRCIEKIMPPSGIKGFASVLHAHTLAQSIKARHFRKNKEMPVIDYDYYYNFKLHVIRKYKKFVNIMPGDLLTTECVYDSSKKSRATLGGPEMSDEMCMTFMYYYPKMNNSKPCFSGLTTPTIMTLSGVEELYDASLDDPIIKYPISLRDKSFMKYLSAKNDWDDEVIAKSSYLFTNNDQKPQCSYFKSSNDIVLNSLIGYPKNLEVFTEPEQKCQSNQQHYQTNNSSNGLIWVIIGLASLAIGMTIYAFKKKVSMQRNSSKISHP